MIKPNKLTENDFKLLQKFMRIAMSVDQKSIIKLLIKIILIVDFYSKNYSNIDCRTFKKIAPPVATK